MARSIGIGVRGRGKLLLPYDHVWRHYRCIYWGSCMSQLPAMPMWWADFFSKTDHLSNEEQWAYAKLLAKTWLRNGQPFPDEPHDLARLLNMGVKRWLKMRERIAPFFDLSDGTWRQPRLENEFLRVAQRNELSRSHGRLGGRPKTNTINMLENPPGYPRETQQKANHIHTHKEEKERDSSKSESLINIRPKSVATDDPDFVAMWVCYPKHEDKGHARIAYRAARKKADAATILAGVQRYCEKSRATEKRFIPLCSTWLNGERWTDGEGNGLDTAPRIPERRGPSRPLTEDERRRVFNLDRK